MATTCPLTEKSTFETVRPEVVAVQGDRAADRLPSERLCVTESGGAAGTEFATLTAALTVAVVPSVANAFTEKG